MKLKQVLTKINYLEAQEYEELLLRIQLQLSLFMVLPHITHNQLEFSMNY